MVGGLKVKREAGVMGLNLCIWLSLFWILHLLTWLMCMCVCLCVHECLCVVCMFVYKGAFDSFPVKHVCGKAFCCWGKVLYKCVLLLFLENAKFSLMWNWIIYYWFIHMYISLWYISGQFCLVHSCMLVCASVVAFIWGYFYFFVYVYKYKSDIKRYM